MKRAFLLALLLALPACSDRAGGNTPPKAPPPVPIAAGPVVQKIVPVQVIAVGNVQAYTSVSIKSRVAGQVVKVHFKEGDDVRRGDVLFTIDPLPFEAAVRQAEATVAKDMANLKQAQATLERDQAQLNNARVQEARYRELLGRELIAREQYDQLKTNFAAMEATVDADRAAVENARASISADQAALDSARLNLSFTTIAAPIDGRAGSVLVQTGNVVKGNDDNPIVVLNQIHPIYLSFSVPEQFLGDIKKYRALGLLKVQARLPNRVEPIATGDLTFINNTVDPGTGTIQLKATFTNADNVLWPGQFLDAVLTLTSQEAIVVPSQAIQPGQKGPYVFVVKDDQTVDSRQVQPGTRLGAETIIVSGLQPGERVVIDGQLRLRPGTKVDVKTQ
ncbi:MAG: efflux RND transporter periplasmic adaptor subunit [Candidatus Rokuibacteriota bacterium]|nr:MAG: efflux RND transporter periplasmic adaptor subunit [Candidatus Rokubacteria bacterium]